MQLRRKEKTLQHLRRANALTIRCFNVIVGLLNILQHPHIGVAKLAVLRKIANFYSLTHSQAAARGRAAPSNNIHQSGLACAIGAHNSHPVVTQQNIAKVLQVVDAIIFHRDMVQLDNRFAKTTADRGHFQIRLGFHILHLGLDLGKALYTVLFLGAARFRAATNPRQLPTINIAQLLRRTGLGDAALLPLLQEQAVVAHINVALAPINFQRAINHSVEEITVMGYHEQSALALHKLLLQPSNSGIVHVVSGLVQNQEVAGTHQNASQGHALALAAAELAHFLLQASNAQLRQHRLGLAFQLPGKLRIHLLLQLQKLLLHLFIIGLFGSCINSHFVLTQ